ncbi:MAG: 2-hydroxyacyl-CoA dehydratase subunit D [Candidatus Zipacnadales bacterium]
MAAIDYFRRILETPDRAQELAASSRVVVGTMCNFVPEALILAVGAVPVRICSGDQETASEGERWAPRDSCPVCRSSIGRLVTRRDLLGGLDLLVVPTVCDAKRKLPQVVEAQVPVHVLAVPADKQADGVEEWWYAEVVRLQHRLEELTGTRLTRQALETAVRTLNARQRAFRELLQLQKAHPPRLSGLEMALVTNASFVADIVDWTKHVRALIAERTHREAGPDGPRLLITGAPIIYPDFQLLTALEEVGAHVVADVMCSGTDRLYIPIVLQEWTLPELLRAVAEISLLPTSCPCFTRSDDRLNRILDVILTHDVEGVVYRNLRLCTLFQFETLWVRAELEKAHIPMLELQMDYTSADTEQLLTRLQAFLEVVEAQRVRRG